MPSSTAKIRENGLRRMAYRQGLHLVKSRARDPRAMDFGNFTVVDSGTNSVVSGVRGTGRPEMDLDEVERYLIG